MAKTLPQYYSDEKTRVIEQCIECGLCAEACPILAHTDLAHTPPEDIQTGIKTYLKTGEPHETVYTRAFSCMECFKCVDGCCPEGLNPMLVNETIKWEYCKNRAVDIPHWAPGEAASTHRVLASIQVTAEEYRKVTTPSDRNSARFVFFPGCNVYFQPEKILSALEITEMITDDVAFVPGLDFCCGDGHLFYGELEEAEKTSARLIEKLCSFNPRTVICWCPTCLCRFETLLSKTAKVPFDMVSFPQFLARHMHRLPFKKKLDKTVTLHEACKAAYTGLDLNGARDVLNQIPGITLVEMPRHGRDTVCCGSGAQDYFPESFERVRDERMQEAAQTRADMLVDVCHHCHNVFSGLEKDYDFEVKNYVTLVAEALGIEKKDNFKQYRQAGDLGEILKHAEPFMAQSPFSKEKIRAVLEKVFFSPL